MLCAGYTEGKVDACQVRDGFLKNYLAGCYKDPLSNHLLVMVLVPTSPGRQRWSSGLPGGKCVEAGRGRQLGDRLC